MASFNRGNPVSPKIKFKAIKKIKEQEYVSEQAYLIPESGGIDIYISYELNKSLEHVFKRYSLNGFMGVREFIRMCEDHHLILKNTNKDILYYIFKQTGSANTGFVSFKEFFQVLHKLSSYIFRKLIMTEQEKFNVLIKHLNVSNQSSGSIEVSEKFNVGIQVGPTKHTIGVNVVTEKKDVSTDITIQYKHKETMTDPVQFRDKEKEQKEKDLKKVLNNNKTPNVPLPRLCSKLSRSAENLEIKKKIEEIEKTVIDKEDTIKILKEEIEKALGIIEDKEEELENMQKEKEEEYEKNAKQVEELNERILQLEQEKTELESKEKMLLEQAEIKEKEKSDNLKHCQETKRDLKKLKELLILPGEEEGELYKIFFVFSAYKPKYAEYVISKRRCADFLAMFYLLQNHKHTKEEMNLNVIDAEKMYSDVIKQKEVNENTEPDDDTLNYLFFKLLLGKIGKFLYPEYNEREAFLEIAINHVLFLEKNKKFLENKKVSVKEKTKKYVKTEPSFDFNVFREPISGGYESSDCPSVKKEIPVKQSDDCKKKESKISNNPLNLQKIMNTKEGLMKIQNHKLNKNLLEHSLDSTDSSDLQKIISNKTKKSNQKISMHPFDRNRKLIIPSKVPKKINKEAKKKIDEEYSSRKYKINKTFAYSSSSSDVHSLDTFSSTSDHQVPFSPIVTYNKKSDKKLNNNSYVHFPKQTFQNPKIKNLNHLLYDTDRRYKNQLTTKQNIPVTPVNYLPPTEWENPERIQINYQRPLALCDIEGTIWPPKSPEKKYFLAKFGKD